MFEMKRFVIFATVWALLSQAVFADDNWQEFIGLRKAELLESYRELPARFYVSLDGRDEWSGRLTEPNAEGTDGPFRTFAAAQAALRQRNREEDSGGKPVVVDVLPGVYELDGPLTFGPDDSGTNDSPIIWRGAGVDPQSGEPLTILRAGKTISGGVPVTDDAILARLKPQVRDKILQFDLRALGVTDYGDYSSESDSAELFLNNKPMTLSRYPNEGFITLEKFVTEGNPIMKLRTTDSYTQGKFILDDDMTNWSAETDAWARGYWCWDWVLTRQKIAHVDPKKKILELEGEHEYGYRAGQYFYVYHLLCELDAPGEYYIDNDSGILYFYPPEEVTEDNLFITVHPSVIAGRGLTHVMFAGFGIDGCRKTAVTISGEDNSIVGCVLRNSGGGGIDLNGNRSLVFGCHLYNLGAYGIGLNGGEPKQILHGNSAAINNDIHHYARVQRVYAPGISIGGCGLLAAHNRITDAPHNAIGFGGVRNRIEFNEIGNVCYESNDAGAIYSGRSWIQRGNVIKNNYFHDIEGFQKKGCVGVYLDDEFSSAEITGNLFVNVTAATFIGGGRDNKITNNIYVECHPAVRIDGRGLNWQKEAVDGRLASLKKDGTVEGLSVVTEPYASAYPELRKVLESENPYAPEGNLFARNVVIRNGWYPDQPALFEGDDIYDEARPYVEIVDNVIGDFRLLTSLEKGQTPEIPNAKIMFERIPTERIGRFEHSAARKR